MKGPVVLWGISLLASAGAAMAEDQQTTEAAAPPTLAQDYCANISNKAAEARAAWQTAKLRELQTEITQKLAELDAKQKELESWVGKRDEMLKAASRELVDIYAKMDPDAAAQQLAKVDATTATSILRQLTPRGASAILNVMEADKAAELVRAISTANKDTPGGGGS